MNAPEAGSEEKVHKWTKEEDLQFTDPDIISAGTRYEHLHRYAFASRFVSGKRVLDLASGEGYGCFIFSKHAESVVGIEIDPKAVVRAENKYIRENIKFIQGSILNIQIEEEKSFDVIVCFEAVEHIEDQNKLFSEVKRLLKDDGLFIVSTPNMQGYTDEHNYHDPLSSKKLYFKKLEELLQNYFANSCFFVQRVYMASDVWPLPKDAPFYKNFSPGIGEEGVYFKNQDGKISLHIIVIASNSSRNMEIIKNYSIGKSNTALNYPDKQISALGVRADALRKCVKERDKRIDELEDLLRSSNQQAHELKCTIADMQQSVLWQLLMKYQFGFVNRVLPHGTGRRKKYDLALKGGRVLFNEGWSSFYKSFINPHGTHSRFNSEHSRKEAASSNERIEQSDDELLVHRQEVPLETITIKAHIELKKGDNLVRFHILEECEKPRDTPAMKNEDGRYLAIRDISITDGITERPMNLGCKWHGIEGSNESSLRWLFNDTIMVVESITDYSAMLVLKTHSFYRPRTLEIYTRSVQTRCNFKDYEGKYILLKGAEIRANKDAVKTELENIFKRLNGEI